MTFDASQLHSWESLTRFSGGLGVGFLDFYKTIMGTIPKSSSHSPSATEAADGVRLLLL